MLLLSLDDLLVVVRKFLNPAVSCSGLDRCLRRLKHTTPMKIVKVLTENSSQFTDRFTGRYKIPSDHHAFDRKCALLGIKHRLIPPRHPQTQGMVERFNGRISEVLNN